MYVYADDGILSLTWAEHLQWYFDTLMYIFDLVVLRTNVYKTVSMAFQPCHTLGGDFLEAYMIRVMDEGHNYW